MPNIQTGSAALPTDDLAQLKQAILAELPESDPAWIHAYLNEGSPDFLMSRSPKEHAALAGMIAQAERKALPFSFRMHSDAFNAITELALIAKDRAAGRTPAFVCATIGTTSSMAIDRGIFHLGRNTSSVARALAIGVGQSGRPTMARIWRIT